MLHHGTSKDSPGAGRALRPTTALPKVRFHFERPACQTRLWVAAELMNLQLAVDAKEFVFSDQWWLLLLIATIGWAGSRRGR